jgi:anti-anti-sigma regulatory factor
LTGALGVIGSAGLMLVVLLIRAGGQGVYADPVNLLLYVMIFGGMVLSRLVTDTARATAEEHAQRAEYAHAESAQRAIELAEANSLLGQQLEQQKQLLELVTTLETPTLTLAEGVMVAPIVGHIDTRRAGVLTQRLLAEVNQTHARLVILDITGVAVMDTTVARAVLDTAQALRLLGCSIAITGISAEVAITLTNLDINLSGIATMRSPQEALSVWHAMSNSPARNSGHETPRPPEA